MAILLTFTVGRNSGFIACHAALASQEVDCCLIPEDIFELQGPGGVLAYVERRLNDKGHCVVVIAEGVGNERFKTTDVGLHVLEEVKKYFKMKQTEISTKYLDPYVASQTEISLKRSDIGEQLTSCAFCFLAHA